MAGIWKHLRPFGEIFHIKPGQYYVKPDRCVRMLVRHTSPEVVLRCLREDFSSSIYFSFSFIYSFQFLSYSSANLRGLHTYVNLEERPDQKFFPMNKVGVGERVINCLMILCHLFFLPLFPNQWRSHGNLWNFRSRKTNLNQSVLEEEFSVKRYILCWILCVNNTEYLPRISSNLKKYHSNMFLKIFYCIWLNGHCF